MRKHTPSIEEISVLILRGRWFLALVSAATIALLFLASWPWCSNRFALKATSRIVEITASAKGVHQIWTPIPAAAEIQVINADVAGLPLDLASVGNDLATVRILASRATLQRVSLPTGATLIGRVAADGSVDIGVLNDGSIDLALSGTIERVAADGSRSTIARIERSTIWNIRAATKNNPARLVLPPGAAPITLYNQPVFDFRFAPPRADGADPRTFQSELLEGELVLLDTAKKTELKPRELVLLEGGTRAVSRLETTARGVAIDLSGEASRISVGPPRPGAAFRLDRDLTPSVLSYLIGQHELKLLWGVALAMLAALWRARQWALKWRK